MSMLGKALPSKHTHDRYARMEDELKCPTCAEFFCNPVLLPCSHSMCSGCAEKCQEPSQNFISQCEDPTTPVIGDTDSSKDFPDIDKVSLVSETDSGVVCNSRPNSYVGTASINNIFQAIQGSVFGIKCPVCKKNVFLDETGHNSLPKNRVLEVIVDKYCGEHKKIKISVKCELCEHEQIAKTATVMCEQCEVFYCNECRDKCHPNRGSLAKHNLVDPVQGKAIIRAKNKGKEAKCIEHADEHLSMYCLLCKTPVCYICHQEGCHMNHDVQALGAMSKSHKTELSQTLQSLSEKAKSGTEFIQMIRGMADKVHGNSVDFEAEVVAQCDALMEAIKHRKQELLASVGHERDLKVRVLKDQVSQCTGLLQRTTGLLHFCIEVLKESDSASFLQMPRRKNHKLSLARRRRWEAYKKQLTDVIVTKDNLTEEIGLGKNITDDITCDETEEIGLGKNITDDCEEPVLLKNRKTNESCNESALSKSATLKSALSKSATLKSASLKSATLKSATLKSAISKSATLKSATLKSATLKSAISKSATLKSATSKSGLYKSDSLEDLDSEEIIIVKESEPTVYDFHQLSSCTKQKLMSKLGIMAEISSNFTAVKKLGKPVQVQSIFGDGNCFFRAVSCALTEKECYHENIRKAVVSHILDQEKYYHTFLRPDENSVYEYVSRKHMLETGTWATELEILAAADLLRTDIYIYDEVASWQLFSAKQIQKSFEVEQEAIYLIHNNQTHYDLVLSVQGVGVECEAMDTEMEDKVTHGCEYLEKDSLARMNLGNHEAVQGNFHQGHPAFSENAGKQCVLNSLSALLYSREKSMHLWTPFDLDQTLIKGDEIYGCLRRSSTMNYDYVSIPDIPRLIEYSEKMFKVEFQESLSGTLGNVQDLDQYQFVTMSEALHLALDQPEIHGALITFKGNTFIVIKQTGGYFVFDSHSRNRAGLQVPSGSSVVKYLNSIQEVYGHCMNLALSMNYSLQDMFEVTAVSVVHHPIEKELSFTGKDKTNSVSIVHKDDMFIKCREKQKQTLLDKYFQYQETMKKKKPHCEKEFGSKLDRKQYMRYYMKKRRESQEFKVNDRKYTIKSMNKTRQSKENCFKELKAQRIARQHLDTKTKNKQSTLKSMTKARESKEFCEQEYKCQKVARQNPRMKMKNKLSTLKSMTKARESKEFCEQEYKSQKCARQNPDIKVKNKQSALKSKRKARESKDFCEQEYEAQKAARQNPDIKVKNKQSALKSKRKARESKDFCEQEYKAQKSARQNPDIKVKNKQSALKSKRKARESKDFCEQEYKAQKSARQNPDIKVKNKQSALKSKRKARESKDFCEQEYKAQKSARQNPDIKVKNKQRALNSKRKARESKEFCDHENEAKRMKRQHPLQLECERILKQESRKRHRINEKQKDKVAKAVKRTNVEFCEHEGDLTTKRTFGNTIDQCIEKFHENAAKGPVFVCTSCHQTWFPKSVVKLSSTNISEKSKAYCTGFKSHDDKEWLCRTCLASLKEDKIPRLSERNGMAWPTKPDVLKLHPLEERLISQRIPFMQIRELPRGGQLSAKGNVVNVPVDIQPTVNALPRQIDEHVTIAVKLKKRLSHKSACFTENVRPNAVMNALEWLMENSEMYKNAGITINTTWKEDVQSNQNELISEYMGKSQLKDNREIESADDGFCEVSQDECIQGNSDTLVDEADTDTNKVYVFAPGENQRPLSLYEDKDAEYLCFPTIFCGQRRKEITERPTPVHYSDIAKWELRSVDRRAAHSVPNIFFKLKKIQAKQVSDKVNLALRRCKSEGKNLTAGQVRDSSTTNEIVRLNEGYYIFRTLRNSPAYLSSKKKDVFAMIRQLGLPTWFMSLSSADTKWPDLLRTLAQLDGKTLSNDDFKTADWSFKTKLVQKDPVTCARFFDNRVQLFVNSFLKSPHNPIGDVTDSFRRVEFQNRGSPHIHMLLWTNDGPRYPDDDEKVLIEYVDKYVTCSLQIDNPELTELVELQIHKHSKTCKKGGKAVCRFGFPLPPLPRTMLLEPLETDVAEYRKKYTELQKKMNDYKDGCSVSFHAFLQTIVHMDEGEYIKCIRASLKSPKIFLKRSPAEMRVNYYNPAILKAWHANLDIQFVLDPYACATYIVSYISKSQRGISALLEKASQEAIEGNMDLRRQVRHIGNKFLNFVEVSAQEASYLILQMPLTQSTRDVIFINTSPPDERVFLLKSQDDLENLPENSTDIKADNMITRYAKRPKQLENWCLADVVSELEVTFPKEYRKCEEENEDDVLEDENFSHEDIVVHLKNGIKIRKRKNKRVIRYVNYSKRTNSEHYYRERILLFLPWRNESTDIIGRYSTFEEHYKSKANIIKSVQKKYEHFTEELEQARLQAECEIDDFDEVAPNTEHAEAEDAVIEPQPSEQYIHFDPDMHVHKNYDIGPDIGLPTKHFEVQTSPIRIPEDQYHKLLQSLNCKQREFHNHVTHWIQHKDEPLYAFLTGGAGTGKSVVIDAVYQTLHRALCSEEGENPDDVKILLCAYTGKAAYNINGMTIASAFHKKMYQAQQNMHADELNTYRTKYRNLSVVIIDEISMVGNKLLAFIHERLQQLTGTKQDFGGVSIIAVGDLYQLSPVGDIWIFKDLSCPGQGLAKNLWREHFTMFELTEIMRQKDDMEFSELLNRLRHNELSNEDKRTIMSRHIEIGSTEYPSTAPHLFIENKFVDDFNSTFMQNLSTNKVDVKADTDVLSQTKLSPEVKKSLIENLPDKPANTGQLKNKLTVAVGMIYDISVNLDVADGLTNGCTCVLKHIEYKHSTIRPAIVWVLFDDENIGAIRRHQYLHLLSKNIDKSWTPIFETKRTFIYNRKTFERIQFPLQPSAAKTVHKAQGATLNQVVVSLSQSKKRKIPHIHYVALSRVRSLKNLHIIDFNEDSLSKDQDVDAEMQRLSENRLKLCFTPLYKVNMHGYFLFNNARSLNKHISDIRSDPNFYAAEIVGIAESRLWESDRNDTFQLEGFRIYRNDADHSLTRPHHGLVTYVKSHLHVSSGLLSRVSSADLSFNKDMEFVPRISPEFELTLDNKSVMHSIQTMNFFQMKAPNKPTILPDDCSAENNSVTIAWQPHIGNVVENYSLELDDGDGGDFRVVYIGKETICTVDGLHFNSTYFARVKASNHAGDSDYSDPISLQTAEVAWFSLDPSASHPDSIFTNKNLTVTSNSFDHRVILGSTGFSKGVHYWEIVIDRYDNNKDPAIGIARFDIDKSVMLGKEDKGWSMYIDDSRSWFLHGDKHEHRTEGGIHVGSVIGVLLDLDKHMLSYYVDEEPHGPIAYPNLHGVFFPAISLNRNVQVTLRTGIEPPIESEDEDDSG